MHNLAIILYNGYGGVPINKDEAIKYFKKAADLGYAKSGLSYGCILCDGKCCEINYEEAAKYYKLAADKGSEAASLYYSILLLEGDGIPINVEEGLKYLEKATKITMRKFMLHIRTNVI